MTLPSFKDFKPKPDEEFFKSKNLLAASCSSIKTSEAGPLQCSHGQLPCSHGRCTLSPFNPLSPAVYDAPPVKDRGQRFPNQGLPNASEILTPSEIVREFLARTSTYCNTLKCKYPVNGKPFERDIPVEVCEWHIENPKSECLKIKCPHAVRRALKKQRVTPEKFKATDILPEVKPESPQNLAGDIQVCDPGAQANLFAEEPPPGSRGQK